MKKTLFLITVLFGLISFAKMKLLLICNRSRNKKKILRFYSFDNIQRISAYKSITHPPTARQNIRPWVVDKLNSISKLYE